MRNSCRGRFDHGSRSLGAVLLLVVVGARTEGLRQAVQVEEVRHVPEQEAAGAVEQPLLLRPPETDSEAEIRRGHGWSAWWTAEVRGARDDGKASMGRRFWR